MAERGTPVTRIASDDVAARAAKAQQPDATVARSVATPPPVSKLDGITDEQAMRIREAVRANKRRRRQEEQAQSTPPPGE